MYLFIIIIYSFFLRDLYLISSLRRLNVREGNSVRLGGYWWIIITFETRIIIFSDLMSQKCQQKSVTSDQLGVS